MILLARILFSIAHLGDAMELHRIPLLVREGAITLLRGRCLTARAVVHGAFASLVSALRASIAIARG
jgi:hypothetical protein